MLMSICVRVMITLFFFYSTDAHAMGSGIGATGEYESAIENTIVGVTSENNCVAIAHSHQLEVTHDVTFTGRAQQQGAWQVPYSLIIVQFDDEPARTWSLDTATFKLALMHWLKQAVAHQQQSGTLVFATRDRSGQINLISQQADEDGTVRCVPHPLEMW